MINIEGQSLSNESVHLFADMLGKSDFISSANLSGVEKDDRTGMVSYSIICSLNSVGAEEGVGSNAD